jgi:hypothetical protein
MSVGGAGGEDGGAVASADQVAPGGCTVRLRSPGDQTSRPAEFELTGALSVKGTYRTVRSFSFSAGVEVRGYQLTRRPKRLVADERRA